MFENLDGAVCACDWYWMLPETLLSSHVYRSLPASTAESTQEDPKNHESRIHAVLYEQGLEPVRVGLVAGSTVRWISVSIILVWLLMSDVSRVVVSFT